MKKKIVLFLTTISLVLSMLIPTFAMEENEYIEDIDVLSSEDVIENEELSEAIDIIEENITDVVDIMEEDVIEDESFAVDAELNDNVSSLLIDDSIENEDSIIYDVADATTINTNQKITGTVEGSDYKRYYKFELQEDGYIYLSQEITKETGYITRYKVYNQDLEYLLQMDVYYNKIGKQYSKSIGLEKGIYYLEVSKNNRFYNYEYNITVNYNIANNWEKEKNNSFQTANTYLEGNKQYGTIYDGDVDYYFFKPTRTGKYIITHKTQTAHWDYIYFYDKDYRLIDKANNGYGVPSYNYSYEFEVSDLGGIYIVIIPGTAYLEYEFTVKPKPLSQNKVDKLVNKKGKKAQISWTFCENANGYEIQYSTDKKFSKGVKTVKIKNNKSSSKTISKLKKGKKYYFRIRAYRTLNGKKEYSKWSAKKSIKIKK